MRFGLAVQSVPARLAPEAVARVLDHYIAHRAPKQGRAEKECDNPLHQHPPPTSFMTVEETTPFMSTLPAMSTPPGHELHHDPP